MHTRHPATMPQFSPVNQKHSYHEESCDQNRLPHTSKNSLDAAEPHKTSVETLPFNICVSDTTRENGRAALETLKYHENSARKIARAPANLVRRSVSSHELGRASYPSNSPNGTLDTGKVSRLPAESARTSRVLSPPSSLSKSPQYEISPIRTPTTSNPDQHECQIRNPLKLKQDLLQDSDGVLSPSQDAFTLSCNREPRQDIAAKGKESSAAEILGNFATDGTLPSTPDQIDHGARRDYEEQQPHQLGIVYDHGDANQHIWGDRPEDAKHCLATRASPPISEPFRNRLCQMCSETNDIRECLARIEQQMSSWRHSITMSPLQGVSAEMSNQFSAHEKHYEEEFQCMNNNLLTLNENVYAIQRSMTRQMAQMNRRMDLLLEAQRADISRGDHVARQGQDLMEQKLRGQALKREENAMNRATVATKQELKAAANMAVSSVAPSPTPQLSTPVTKRRNPTPLPAKLPVMAAALTSTPPHVPELPKSQSQSSPYAKVRITDPSIPSPSAVSNARRIRQEDGRNQKVVGTANRGAGVVAKAPALATAIQGKESHVHPALRYQSGHQRLASGTDKQQTAKEKMKEEMNQVLWRKPSDNGEIGGGWYNAAMQQ